MPSHFISIAFFLSFSFLLHSSLAGVICEELPLDLCSFSISSTGKRCLLESHSTSTSSAGEQLKYECRASEVVAERFSDWIEGDDCVKACGIDRMAKGISSDGLLDSRFTGTLCTLACFENCPNIVDIYFNLAAAEGVFLPDLCHDHQLNPRRSMVGLLSSGAALGPAASNSLVADEVAPPPTTA